VPSMRLERTASRGCEKLAEGGSGAFYAAREDRLAPDEGADQHMGVREAAAFPGQPTDEPIGV